MDLDKIAAVQEIIYKLGLELEEKPPLTVGSFDGVYQTEGPFITNKTN